MCEGRALSLLEIKAGPKAYQQIREQGLSPADVRAVFGASGAAKWLAIYGLDRAIFSQWLAPAEQEILLFGTSVGAFKLAAACHADAAAGLDALKRAYIHQSYPNGAGLDEIEREFSNIAAAVVSPEHIEQILSHPRFRFACGAVRCHGGLASKESRAQLLACSRAAVNNLKGRTGMQEQLERCVFVDSRANFPIASGDGYITRQVSLDSGNTRLALKASGSIPISMHGVENVPGAPQGMYRDGGLLDYHPVPSSFWLDDGLILYPHFYDHCKVGWFDKLLPWRKASARQLDQVVMISPSPAYIESLELGRIPDRKDFKRYQHNDAERIRLWEQATEQSLKMGEEFLALATSGDLAAAVQPL